MSNAYDGKRLTFKEQVELFEKRGMKFREGKEKAEYKIKFINYYKIKEFSLPFMDENEKINYFIINCIHCNIKPNFCSKRKNRQQGLPHKQKNWGISLS